MESASPRLDTLSTLPQGNSMSLAAVVSTTESTGDQSTKADEMRQTWLDQMPAHWRTPDKPIEKRIFSSLVFGAVGQSDLTEMWVACRDERAFRAYNERMMKRVATITVVGAILTIPLVALVTSTPPRARIINYTIRGAHIMLFNSFATMFATVVVGLCILHSFSGIDRESFITTSMGTRVNVYCFLALMGSPFQQVCVASIIGSLGLLVAAYSAHDKIIKGGAIFNVLLPVLPLLVYFGSVWYSGQKVKRTTSRPISPPASLTMIEVEQNAKEREKEEV